VQLDSAGVDAYLALNSPPARRRYSDQPQRIYDRAVAEAALAGILAFYRQLPRLFLAQPFDAGLRPRSSRTSALWDGQRVLVLGAGAIARRLGAAVTRIRRGGAVVFPHLPVRLALHGGRCRRRAATTDLLINTLPHTPETIGFLSRTRLARLKIGAIVVNVGRGSTLDEVALLELIDSGHLGGAVLDVTAGRTPPARESALASSQGASHAAHRRTLPREIDRKLDVFLANLARFERGDPLQNCVDASSRLLINGSAQ